MAIGQGKRDDRENGRGGGSVQIVNDGETPASFAIAAGEAGVYRDLMGQWYGYLFGG
jgi:hypothetical protein